MADIVTERAEPRAFPLSNPAPLGLSAFALTTFVSQASNAGFILPQGTGGAIFLGLALFYGGLAQFCAGMWEFRTGNTFGSTAFTSYGAFWMSLGFALLPIFGGKSLAALAGGTAVGVYLLGWTIFTGIMLLGTFRLTGALIGVFGFLFLTFLFLTIGALAGSTGMTQVGGWLGVITALVAWYTAAAQVLDATNSAIRLPTFPLETR
jgi:succinate-acetate transporter protein